MKHLRRPRPRTLAASAVLLAAVITAGLVGRGTAPDPAPTPAPTVAAAPAVDEGTPYTAKVFLQVNCGPFPTARVTLDPTPGGHPDVHLEVGQLPYIHAPQPIFSSVTELNLAPPPTAWRRPSGWIRPPRSAWTPLIARSSCPHNRTSAAHSGPVRGRRTMRDPSAGSRTYPDEAPWVAVGSTEVPYDCSP